MAKAKSSTAGRSTHTSVVIDLDHIDAEQLPKELAISALTMAELAAGPHATADAGERARRQDRLQRAEASFDPLPFESDSARAYGRIYAAIMATGRKARAPELLIPRSPPPPRPPAPSRSLTRATSMTSEGSNTSWPSSASDPHGFRTQQWKQP